MDDDRCNDNKSRLLARLWRATGSEGNPRWGGGVAAFLRWCSGLQIFSGQDTGKYGTDTDWPEMATE